MHYTIEKITSLIGARLFGAHSTDTRIDWLLTDSRSLAFPETTLFFALRSKRNDGHRYIGDLYRRGIRNFVVGTVPANFQSVFPEANFLLVVSPLKALQRLAERHREEFAIPVIGITGSNGKTIVKEWLYQLLSPSRCITRSPRSYNSQIGVPLSVCLLNDRSELGIFEAGISQNGEMEALRAIIQPTIGIMTNIGQAHQENFSTIEEKCLEKISLFKDAEVIIFQQDDSIIKESLSAGSLRGELFGWSEKDSTARLFIRRAEKQNDTTTINYVFEGTEHALTIPFVDAASVQNVIHCLAVCLYLRCTPQYIAERMARLEPVAMRLEVKQGVRGCTIINDSYNSDINSLDIALDFLERRTNALQTAGKTSGENKSAVLILSDIQQSGLSPEELYGKVAEMVNRRHIAQFIGIGEEIFKMQHLFAANRETSFYHNTKELLEDSRSPLLADLTGKTILLKGARSFNFESLTEYLVLKVHETTLEVNLEALAENVNYYRSFMKPETKMVCMVKASAYGAGSEEVAKTLQDRGVDYLAVAVADEGAALRKAGITSNIIVMNPEVTSFGTLFKYELEVEVYSFELLEALIQAAKKEGITNFPIHIKLDTGMCRLGFNPKKDMPQLIDRLRHQAALIPRSVFSHFVGSDSPDFDEFSARQFALFDEASRSLQQAFPHKILRHICNSAGIERFPERHLDMVRLGIGLYGISPIDNHIINNVSSLRTTILQIHEAAEGETVGYSRRGRLTRASRIASIPIGYADGLNRHLGNGNCYCLVNGEKAYYVGNICMDVCMIDVTNVPCRAGDEVEIFGDHLPVTVLSDVLKTIPYEVLTNVSERVKRVYFQ